MTANSGHDDGALSDVELRVRALESILTEKGYIDPAAVDAVVEAYQTRIGPRNGARVVAKAWADEEFAQWLREDATAAIASCGFTGRQGDEIVAVENTPAEHNMVVCTLCSCYPVADTGPAAGLVQIARRIVRARCSIRAACWPSSA